MSDFFLGALLYIAVGLIPSAAMFWFGWQSWTGRRRAWAASGPAFGQFTNGKNYLPLAIGVAGIAWFVLITGVLLESFDKNLGSAVILAAAVPGVFVVCSWFWWPRFLTPAWHKDWVARGGTASTPLYTDSFPDTTRPKKRQRATGISLKNRSQP